MKTFRVYSLPQILGSSLSLGEWFAAILPFNLLLKKDMDVVSQNYLPYSFAFHTLQSVGYLPTHKKRQVWPSFSMRIPVCCHCWSLRSCPSIKAAVHKFILSAERVEYNLKQIIIECFILWHCPSNIFCSTEIKIFWHSVAFSAIAAAQICLPFVLPLVFTLSLFFKGGY